MFIFTRHGCTMVTCDPSTLPTMELPDWLLGDESKVSTLTEMPNWTTKSLSWKRDAKLILRPA